MLMKRILLLIVLLAAAMTDATAAISFRRAPAYSRDTVTSAKYNVICITDVGNLAAINGEQVKVYKTGAFGKQVSLKPGDNPIEITLFQGTNVESRNFSIYYDASKGSVSQPTPQPQLEDRLFYVETKELAYLQYGFGGDRLGGSKMGFLDPGIVLKVVGQIDDLYKVQLSANRYAYIHIEDVEMTPRSSHTVNTNNIGITNPGDFDRIRLALPERRPYASRTSLAYPAAMMAWAICSFVVAVCPVRRNGRTSMPDASSRVRMISLRLSRRSRATSMARMSTGWSMSTSRPRICSSW